MTPRIPHLTIGHLWVVASLACVVGSIAARPVQPADFWHFLESGRFMVQARTVFDYDRATFTISGQPLVDLHWGSQVLFYLGYALGGVAWLVAAHALAMGSAFGLIAAVAWRRTASLRLTAFTVLIAFVVAVPGLGLRPQSLSVLCFAATLALLEYRVLWPLPALFALWANLHAAFPVGLALVAAYAAGGPVHAPARPPGPEQEQERRAGWRPVVDVPVLAALAASAAATLATPWGLRIYPELLAIEPLARAARITEWSPTTLRSLAGALFFATAFGLALGRALAGRRWRLRELIVLLAFSVLVLRQERAMVWWAIATAPLIADTMAAVAAARHARTAASPSGERRPPDRIALNWMFAAVLIAHVVGSSPWLKAGYPLLLPRQRLLLAPDTPVAMMGALAATPGVSRVFAEMTWGGYVGWTFGGRLRVFYDSRVHIFPRSVIDAYLDICAARPGWARALDDARVDALALSKGSQPALIAAARAAPAWRVVFEDASGVALVRAARGLE